jgi:hypothetical protein
MKFLDMPKIGVFCPQHTKGHLLEDEYMRALYRELRDKHGFRETPWQFIYRDQKAGLVLPVTGKQNEVHIRFYSNRIHAEYEIGRAYIQHFGGIRYNANKYIRHILSDSAILGSSHQLDRLLGDHLLSPRERAMPKWNYLSCDDPFLARRKTEQVARTGALVLLADVLVGWKTIATILGLLAIIGTVLFSERIFMVLAALMFAIIVVAPSRGKP